MLNRFPIFQLPALIEWLQWYALRVREKRKE
jgi:hypothetical protein